MNIAGGFFRIWIVFTVLWIGGCAWAFFPILTGQCPPKVSATYEDGLVCRLRSGPPEGQYFVWWEGSQHTFAITFGAPAALLFLGLAAGWIARGFKSN
jgi:hypothetical protein